jgi:hypothetical protein
MPLARFRTDRDAEVRQCLDNIPEPEGGGNVAGRCCKRAAVLNRFRQIPEITATARK